MINHEKDIYGYLQGQLAYNQEAQPSKTTESQHHAV